MNSWKSVSRNRALILNYHRVSPDIECDPFAMVVTPDCFAEHLEVLRKFSYPMKLSQLTNAIKADNIPANAVAITFDDGYVDNLTYAKPLLDRYAIPATVFVTSGYIESNREFWWDELSRILLKSQELPRTLYLSKNRKINKWHLYAEASSRDHYHCNYKWRIPEKDNSMIRRCILSELRQLFLTLLQYDQRRLLDELLECIKFGPAIRPISHVSSQELLLLVKNRLIDIGAHTVTHPVLALLPEDKQYAEIQQSKNKLEEILGFSVTSFAYPFGQLIDYTKRTVSIVKEIGLSCACTTFNSYILSGMDCYELPRKSIRNWNGHNFEKQIRIMR